MLHPYSSTQYTNMAELQSTSQTTNRSSPVDDHKKEDSTHDQENFSPPVTSRNTSHDETVSPGSSSTRSSGFGSRSFPFSSDHESPTVLNTLHPRSAGMETKILELQGEISQISSQIHGVVESSVREPCMKIDEKVSLMDDKVTTLENKLAEVSKNVATILQCVRPQNPALIELREDSLSSCGSVPSLQPIVVIGLVQTVYKQAVHHHKMLVSLSPPMILLILSREAD